MSDIVNNIISSYGKSQNSGPNTDAFEIPSLNTQANDVPSNMSTISSATNSSTFYPSSLIIRNSIMITLHDLHRLVCRLQQFFSITDLK